MSSSITVSVVWLYIVHLTVCNAEIFSEIRQSGSSSDDLREIKRDNSEISHNDNDFWKRKFLEIMRQSSTVSNNSRNFARGLEVNGSLKNESLDLYNKERIDLISSSGIAGEDDALEKNLHFNEPKKDIAREKNIDKSQDILRSSMALRQVATTQSSEDNATPAYVWYNNEHYVTPEVLFFRPTAMTPFNKSASLIEEMTDVDEVLADEHLNGGEESVINTPPWSRVETSLLSDEMSENAPSGADDDLVKVETQILPSLEHRRYRREACEYVISGSGFVAINAQFTVDNFSTSIQPADLASALHHYFLTTVLNDQGVNPEVESDGVSIASSTVHVKVIFESDLAEICQDIDTASLAISVAKALIKLDKEDHFVVGSQTFSISKPMVENSLDQFDPAACFLCAQHHKCVQGSSTEWSCQFFNEYFYPFGINKSDHTLPRDIELVSSKVDLMYSLPFGNRLFDSIWISVNGLISFGYDNSSFTPKKLPVDSYSNLLAVYWSDLDLLSGDDRAEIYYQLHTKNSTTKAIFDKANSDVVHNSEELKSYDATSILVVTWVEVPAHQSSDERVSFQCVIVTNGFSSFAMYKYANGAMKFNPTMTRPVVVGWGETNLDTQTSAYYVFDIVQGNANDGITGSWFFKIGSNENYNRRCQNWYLANIGETILEQWLKAVPECPCIETITSSRALWTMTNEGNCYDTVPNFGEIGMRCCYREGGNFENTPHSAGAFQRLNALGNNKSAHILNDVLPYSWCCEQSDLCEKYYEVRPISTCNSNSFQRGLLFGLSHIITLDQRLYTFNGLGEYRILEIFKAQEVNFIMQGRTYRAIYINGTSALATVWGALTFKTTAGDIFSVAMNSNRTSMIIYVNSVDVSRRFYEKYNFNDSFENMFLKRMADSIQVVTTDDIAVTVRMATQMLEFTIDLPMKFKRLTRGLLGNFNDLDSDDFMFPNGTILPNNSKESFLFEYGNTWRVIDSLFVYNYGQNTSTFYDQNFKPFFLDENLQYVEEASKVCNGKSNLPCIFDFIVTRNAQLANSSANALIYHEMIVTLKEQKPPSLNQVSRTLVKDGESFSITVPGSSEDGENVTCKNISSISYSVQTVNKTSCVIQGIANSHELDIIAVSTVAPTGIESMVVQVPLIFCSCKNGGQCDYNQLRRLGNSYNFFASCICELGYSGMSCELDKDGCASRPCPTNCTDVPAERERTTGQAYQCGSCLTGFGLNQNKTKCEDINECIASNPCGSNSKCVNTIGSFNCLCSTGYRLAERNKSLCVDINECVESMHQCDQICVNTAGSFHCNCFNGYQLVNGSNCTLIIDPCANVSGGNVKCQLGCHIVDNKAECYCRAGFRLKNDGQQCEDINECNENICSQNCVNTVGNYTCSCYVGYILTGPQTCVECPGSTYGFMCTKTCNCKGRAERCDKVKGCICRENWRGENCEIDVDECATGPSKCRPDQFCSNTIGSFSCECEEGYEEVNGTCNNIDECKSAILNSCQQICVDTVGSYVCECKEGYTKTGNTCTDIDECLLGSSQCQQTCTNNIGSYSCGCLAGYTLTDDRRTCFKDLDLCNNSYISCSQGCTLNNKTTVCFCYKGYRLATNKLDCIDINECEEKSNHCFNDRSCINLPGTYSCNCPDGYKLQNDMRTCRPCDMYHWGPGCSNDCSCFSKGTNSCQPITGCVCKEGWNGHRCQDNINECNSNTTHCPDNSMCTNTVGSYNCQCRNGYVYSNKACIDINECEMYAPCDQQCDNTPGSYKCLCSKGFYVDGDNCKDIDECSVTELNNCEQSCRNTIGGFACECSDGYILNTTTRNSCYLVNGSNSCRNESYCDHYCVLDESGEMMCSCRPGFTLNRDGRTCADVDECRQVDACTMGTCQNRKGSFECLCNNSFKLQPDRTTCKLCDPWSYGKNCSGVCTCDRDNTISCDPLTAVCNCLPGWNGTNCTEDVEECKEGRACPSNSTCIDGPGFYRCVCEIGFYSSGDFTCRSCGTWKNGVDCNSQCLCVSNNTVDCNDVTGLCTCKSGWTGTNCDLDIDECINNSSYCLGSHEKCFNLNGTAECRCLPGYERKLNQTLCTDVDKCLDPILTNCTSSQDCKNTEGSFYCVCKPGYKQLNNTCHVNFREYFIVLRLDYPNSLITQNILDNNKKDFYILATDIQQQLVTLYKGVKEAFLPPKILDFRSGSLIADVLFGLDLNYSDNPTYDIALYAQSLQSSGHLVIGNLSVAILSITVNGQKVPLSVDYCDLYTALKKTCSVGELCVEDTATTPCDPSNGDNNDWIIGLAVGLPLGALLIVMVVVVVVCVKRRKKIQRQKSDYDTLDTERLPASDYDRIITQSSGPYINLNVIKSEARDDLTGEYTDIFEKNPETESEEHIYTDAHELGQALESSEDTYIDVSSIERSGPSQEEDT